MKVKYIVNFLHRHSETPRSAVITERLSTPPHFVIDVEAGDFQMNTVINALC